MNSAVKRTISAFLALLLLFLAIPMTGMPALAEESEIATTDGEAAAPIVLYDKSTANVTTANAAALITNKLTLYTAGKTLEGYTADGNLTYGIIPNEAIADGYVTLPEIEGGWYDPSTHEKIIKVSASLLGTDEIAAYTTPSKLLLSNDYNSTTAGASAGTNAVYAKDENGNGYVQIKSASSGINVPLIASNQTACMEFRNYYGRSVMTLSFSLTPETETIPALLIRFRTKDGGNTEGSMKLMSISANTLQFAHGKITGPTMKVGETYEIVLVVSVLNTSDTASTVTVTPYVNGICYGTESKENIPVTVNNGTATTAIERIHFFGAKSSELQTLQIDDLRVYLGIDPVTIPKTLTLYTAGKTLDGFASDGNISAGEVSEDKIVDDYVMLPEVAGGWYDPITHEKITKVPVSVLGTGEVAAYTSVADGVIYENDFSSGKGSISIGNGTVIEDGMIHVFGNTPDIKAEDGTVITDNTKDKNINYSFGSLYKAGYANAMTMSVSFTVVVKSDRMAPMAIRFRNTNNTALTDIITINETSVLLYNGKTINVKKGDVLDVSLVITVTNPAVSGNNGTLTVDSFINGVSYGATSKSEAISVYTGTTNDLALLQFQHNYTNVASHERNTYIDNYRLYQGVDPKAVPAIEPLSGAAIRLDGNTDRSGIRFSFRMEKERYNNALLAGSAVSVGAMIIPADWLESGALSALTHEALSAAGLSPIDLPISQFYEEGDVGYHCFDISIVKLLAQNYARSFVAVGYLKIDGEYFYSHISDSRSIYEVARNYAMSGDLNTPEGADEATVALYETRQAIVESYLDRVLVLELGDTLEKVDIDKGYLYESPYTVSCTFDGKITVSGDVSKITAIILNGDVYTDGWQISGSTLTCTIEVEPIELVLSAEIEKAKGGKDAIVVIVHDDGDLGTARYLSEQFEANKLVGTIGMISSNVVDPTTGELKTSAIAAWQALLDTGRFSISSHTQTHKFWGLTDEAESGIYLDTSNKEVEYSFEAGQITREVKGSQDDLRRAFPSQRVITFIKAGFGKHLSGVQISEKAFDIIDDYYITMRNTGGGVDSIPALNPYSIKSYMVTASDTTETWTGYVDQAIAQNGMIVFLFHGIINTASGGSVAKSTATPFFAYVGEKQADGEIWVATFEEASLYTEELRTASVAVEETESGIAVTLTDEWDNTLYNAALTVRVNLPESYASAETLTVNGGETVSVIRDFTGAYVYLDIVPDSGTVVLSK